MKEVTLYSLSQKARRIFWMLVANDSYVQILAKVPINIQLVYLLINFINI